MESKKKVWMRIVGFGERYLVGRREMKVGVESERGFGGGHVCGSKIKINGS